MAVVGALIVAGLLRRGGSTPQGVLSTEPVETIVRCYEASGLYTIVKPLKEEATKIVFKYGDEEWTPGKKNPFVPAGRALREFQWPIGASSCDDPERNFAEKDVDDPTPMMQEGASWYRTLRQALGALGVSLKNPFLILLLIVVALAALGGGYILGNTNPIVPRP